MVSKSDANIRPTIQVIFPTAISGEVLSAKIKRCMAGEAMRKWMQNMISRSQKSRTLFGAFLDAIDTHGRKIKLVEDFNRVEETYGELLKKSLALGRLGTKISVKNEAIGVLMPNITNTICLIFGLSAFSRLPAMLNYTAGTTGIQNACIASKINTIITSKQFINTAKLNDVLAKLEHIKIVYLEDLKTQMNVWDKLWLMGFAYWLPRLALSKPDSEQAAIILFTSGSEGKPKGVVHSHHSILANVAQIRAVIDFSPADKFMMVLPLFHAFGFTCGAIMPLITGTRLFLFLSPLQYKVIPEVIYDSGCTVLFGTSTFLGNYAKFARPYDFYKLRYVIAGAEKLNEAVRKIYQEKFGIRILEGYGATECAPVLSVNTPMANLIGSVGPLVPGLEAKLEYIPGITNGGLLSVKGPNVMMGYYLFDNPGILKAPEGGWYNTGDIVEIDTAGFVHIKGRMKRFAKIAGEMISLEIVETIANTASPEFSHAASTQIDAQRGENIILFTTDADLKREDLNSASKELGTTDLAVPRKIVLVDKLPILGTGKTDYVKLKNMAETVL